MRSKRRGHVVIPQASSVSPPLLPISGLQGPRDTTTRDETTTVLSTTVQLGFRDYWKVSRRGGAEARQIPHSRGLAILLPQ